MRTILKAFPAAVLLFVTANLCHAYEIGSHPVAAGLSYRYVFVTNGTYAATSSDIATYNTFITDNDASGITITGLASQPDWKAIASTPTTDARDNTGTTGTGVPIYLLPDSATGTAELLANNNSDFWGGSLLHEININQNGDTVTTAPFLVWTGTDDAGYRGAVFPDEFDTALGVTLGSGDSKPLIGDIQEKNDLNWIAGANNSLGQSLSHRLYAMSTPITVPDPTPAIPEPSSLFLAGLIGLVGFSGHRARRRRKEAVTQESEV